MEILVSLYGYGGPSVRGEVIVEADPRVSRNPLGYCRIAKMAEEILLVAWHSEHDQAPRGSGNGKAPAPGASIHGS